MVNKQRLYWTLQVGGWTFYAIVQIAFSVLASDEQRVSSERAIFLIYEAILCLLLTHGYRYLINQRKWLSLGMAKLIPGVILAVMVLGLLTYFLRMPVSIPLGIY